MPKTLLLLDLDGVLITTPTWRADDLAEDGYARFNTTAVDCLNKLLAFADLDIWLSSSRRKALSLDACQEIFRQRGLQQVPLGFLPIYPPSYSRKVEVLTFLKARGSTNFLILDDDKSLNGLDSFYKNRLVLTSYYKGFGVEELELAKRILE